MKISKENLKITTEETNQKTSNLIEKVSYKRNLNIGQNVRGITLIVLVVTIIVLLILAGISIYTLTGKNGIVKRTNEAKIVTQKATVKEQAQLDILNNITENDGKDISKQDLKNILDKYFTNVPNIKEEGSDEENSFWKNFPDDTTELTANEENGGENIKLKISEIYDETFSDGNIHSGDVSGDEGGQGDVVSSAELAALQEKVDTLESKVNSNQEDTKASISSLEAQMETLQESMASSGETKQQVAALQSELQGLKAQVESEKEASANELGDIKDKLSSFESRVASAEKAFSLDKVYPVGSIFISTTISTPQDVAAKLGGKWEQYAQGRTLVGINTSEAEFNTVNKTGGNKNMQSHTHSIPVLNGTTSQTGEHKHSLGDGKWMGIGIRSDNNGSTFGYGDAFNFYTGNGVWYNYYKGNFSTTTTAGAHTHSVTTTASTTGSYGSGDAQNLQPYIVTYMWKRIE